MNAKKILVVEDDLALSAGLCFELDTSGYLTVAAYGCQKARYFLENEHFDLVILDVNLPDGNGSDLCREIKAARPELPVIFLTANDLEEDILNGFDLGADDYITKPFSPSELVARVKANLARYERLIGSGMPVNDVIEIRGLKIDKTARRVWINGEEKISPRRNSTSSPSWPRTPTMCIRKRNYFPKSGTWNPSGILQR